MHDFFFWIDRPMAKLWPICIFLEYFIFYKLQNGVLVNWIGLLKKVENLTKFSNGHILNEVHQMFYLCLKSSLDAIQSVLPFILCNKNNAPCDCWLLKSNNILWVAEYFFWTICTFCTIKCSLNQDVVSFQRIQILWIFDLTTENFRFIWTNGHTPWNWILYPKRYKIFYIRHVYMKDQFRFCEFWFYFE